MLKSSDSRILITGGAGFIGSALVWELNRRGCENIVVCDRLSTDEKWKNLVPLKFADYIDGNDLLQAVQHRARQSLGRFDHVLHLGACSATTERDATTSCGTTTSSPSSSASGRSPIRPALSMPPPPPPMAMAAHGMDDQDRHPQAAPAEHVRLLEAPLRPPRQAQGWLPKIVGLKYFNVYGPNEDHKADMRSLVHKACGQILATGKVQLFKSHSPDYKDGEQMRDFLYVKDAIRMTLHLAETPSAGGLFNLGSGKANTWVQLATAIFAALGKRAQHRVHRHAGAPAARSINTTPAPTSPNSAPPASPKKSPPHRSRARLRPRLPHGRQASRGRICLTRTVKLPRRSSLPHRSADFRIECIQRQPWYRLVQDARGDAQA
jgi:ADP-L-glycero-D-manno-heptose 6-epimerase